MTAPPRGSSYVRPSPRRLDDLSDRLSERDFGILLDLDRLRLLSAEHIEVLHFADLHGRSREVVRGRVLRRLTAWGLITPLARRIGGTRRGSARTVYQLDSAGQQLVQQRQAAETPTLRVRRPTVVGERFQRHTLAVSDLYASLVPGAAAAGVTLTEFQAEPAAWWPDGLGGWLKPDAYVRLSGSQFDDHWWAEIDLATESLPTLRRKLLVYLDFYGRGQLGPNGIMPRVLVSTVSDARRLAIHDVILRLPDPASELFVSCLDRNAVPALTGSFIV